ncbi:Squalene--hopene cyclase [Polystyrenella longa]|uniref:Squalene--hopene cyclase n=1 Tax=Polystyrenella longa TaxID=2528007 RepID=A0A518CQK2_9PLAN|nr:prenyltransferase/squalene oxidase repeat-containing protein [Polystyrenella longa]QDU81502.1 Squalene--hopene cyclase [Polystyrenella longa]
MSSGTPQPSRNRLDSIGESSIDPALWEETPVIEPEELTEAIVNSCEYFFDQQAPAGYWVGELQGDTILESEYVLLLTYLGKEDSQDVELAANYIVSQQTSEGGWATYPGGPTDISVSVKAYLALKIAGHDPESERMQRAREAILAAGGAEKMNSFTRYYMAVLGILSWQQCPAVPPELMLLPKWMPFNIYDMSAWSRTIVVPLSIIWNYKPVRQIDSKFHIDEIFVKTAQELPASMPKSTVVDDTGKKRLIDWWRFFQITDSGLKWIDRLRLRPFKNIAAKKAEEWMLHRFAGSDGLGAIFPPIIWSIISLGCRGYKEDAPEIQAPHEELNRLKIYEDDTLRLQPCKSPVWDTAITTIALREANVSPDHPSLRKSVDWLLSKEVRTEGDWAENLKGAEPSGWFFEFENKFYPDTDDTCMVLMALCRSLPENNVGQWSADLLLDDWSPHEIDKDVSAIISTRASDIYDATTQIDRLTPILNSLRRGCRWVLAMQSKDGGWGAFDPNNTRDIYTQVPFADHNAMIDPSTVDLTGRMLEMFATLNISRNHSAVKLALQHVWKNQERDFTWFGRWGVNYIYGTWQCLVGLAEIGVPAHDVRVIKAAQWLKECQQSDGGWGETVATYDNPTLKGTGTTTPSQTAWALMGLMAAGETQTPAVARGVKFLLDRQEEEGTWEETEFTGTGFPRVFYLRYHEYRNYFPLMALARFRRLMQEAESRQR